MMQEWADRIVRLIWVVPSSACSISFIAKAIEDNRCRCWKPPRTAVRVFRALAYTSEGSF